MSKTKNEEVNEPIVDQPTEEQSEVSAQPTVYDELLKNGTGLLTAKTREELAELVDNIPADCKYSVGAVGQNPVTGLFTLQVDIV